MIKRLFSQSILAMFIKVSASIIGTLMNMLISKLLPLQEFGVYGIIFSLLLAFMFLGTFGMHVSVMQFYPKIEKNYGKSSADHFLYHCLGWLKRKWVLVFGALVTIGLAFLGFEQLNEREHIIPFYAVPFIAALAICLTLSEFLSAVLRIKERNVAALAPRDLYWRGFVCIAVQIFIYYQLSVDLGMLLVVMSLLAIIIIGYQTSLFLNLVKNDTKYVSDEEHYDKNDLSHSLRYSWANILAMTLIFQSMTSVIGYFLGAEQAGIYFAADRLAYMMGLVSVGLTLISTPILSKAFHNNQRVRLRKIYFMICLFGGALTLPILTAIIFHGDWVLSSFYEPEYAEGHMVFIIIGSAWFLSTVFGPIVSVAQAAGQERTVFIVTATVATLSLTSSFFLVPAYGAIGGAFSILLMALLQKSTLLIVLYKKVIAG